MVRQWSELFDFEKKSEPKAFARPRNSTLHAVMPASNFCHEYGFRQQMSYLHRLGVNSL